MTVFASGPRRLEPVPAWDAAAGFEPGDDVFAVRSGEDDDALAVLGATGHRLAFWEAQYRDRPPHWPRIEHLKQRLTRGAPRLDTALAEQVLAELVALVGTLGPTEWFAPLGICHPDHRILGAIIPRLVGLTGDVDWHVYDDLPYALERPDERDAAHRHLASAGLELTRTESVTGGALKRASAACYRSQLGPLGDRVEAAIEAPEFVYRLRPRP